MTRLSARRMLQVALWGSLAVHLASLTVLAVTTAFTPRADREIVIDAFAGEQRVIELRISQASPELPPLPEIEPTESPLLVTPEAAFVRDRVFVEKSTAEVMEEPPARRETPKVAIAIEPPRPLAEREAESGGSPPAAKASPPTQVARTRRVVEPTPPSPAAVPKLVGSAVSAPSFLYSPPPRYPEVAQRNRWQGRVLLRMVIEPSGRVSGVEVLKSSGYALLDAEAVNAVRQWRARPNANGQRSEHALPVRFRL